MLMIADRIAALPADKPVLSEVERGYDADTIRDDIARAGVETVIPAKSNRRDPGRHDCWKPRWRNRIERLFNKLKNWRRIATR